MTHEALRAACSALPEVKETFPFGLNVLVFKVAGKMFALLPLEQDPPSISLKCEPARAEQLREQHPAITPGYHLNKRHWNTLITDALEEGLVLELIEHSYRRVLEGLPRTERLRLLAFLNAGR